MHALHANFNHHHNCRLPMSIDMDESQCWKASIFLCSYNITIILKHTLNCVHISLKENRFYK